MQSDEKNLNIERLTEEALTTPPGFELSKDFAADVAAKAARKFAWDEYVREFSVYAVVILALILASGGIAFVWFGMNWTELWQLVSTNLSLIAGALFLLFFVLFADKVLLRYFIYKYSGRQRGNS